MHDPVLAVTSAVARAESGLLRVELEADYLEAARIAGTLPVVVSPTAAPDRRSRLLDEAHALLLTGGADVEPSLYGEAPEGARSIDRERDAFEIHLLEIALARGLPVLAICRGCQLLNVALGGTLWQDLGAAGRWMDHDRWREPDADVHGVRIEAPRLLDGVLREGEDVLQNSAHHQGIRKLAPRLRAVAWAPDGLVEAVEAAEGADWVVGVQWHPERKLSDLSGTNRRLFERLGREARRARDGREAEGS